MISRDRPVYRHSDIDGCEIIYSELRSVPVTLFGIKVRTRLATDEELEELFNGG